VAGRARALTRSAATCLEREAARPCAQAGVRHVVFSTLEDPSKLLPAGALPELRAHPGYVVAHFQSKAAIQVLPICAPCRTAVSCARLAGTGVLGHPRCAAAPLRTVCLATAAGEQSRCRASALLTWQLWPHDSGHGIVCSSAVCSASRGLHSPAEGVLFHRQKSDVLLLSTCFRHHGHG